MPRLLDDDRTLLRTVAAGLPAVRIRDAAPPARRRDHHLPAVSVRRVVSIQDTLQVARQKIHVGRVDARKVVDVTLYKDRLGSRLARAGAQTSSSN